MTKTLNLEWQTQGITPALLTGEDALAMYKALPKQVRDNLSYDEDSKSVIGSTPFASAILDVEAQKYGARTPNLRDLSRPEVMRIARDRFYIDSRNLVVRSNTDPHFSRNDALLKQIYELAEEKEGNVKSPFMIECFTFVPDRKDKTGYGLKIVPLSDFKVTQDERFNGEHSGKKFSEVDELGIPKFYASGNRTWYAKDKGLSRLCLDGYLGLVSGNGLLAGSNDVG
ncbi:MAG: hypothetical protein ACHQUA_02875, partial [Microgenomates group bacterium]